MIHRTIMFFLLWSTASAASIVTVHDQTVRHGFPMFGEPIIEGGHVAFPAALGAFGVEQLDYGTLGLGLPEGWHRVGLAGGAYGVGNAVFVTANTDVAYAEWLTIGSGPWSHSFDVFVTPLPSDFNHDGAANAADYPVWRNGNGSRADYQTWKGDYGAVEFRLSVYLFTGDKLGIQPPSIGLHTLTLDYLPNVVPDGEIVAVWLGVLIGFILRGNFRR